ncbi:hypothetical protein EV187_2932 [Agromyces ramosus]|uniref:Uncharacterized protein n=1 Tax=Agromyces ramosus TaxID=33879 RepID=A0A4Q7M8V4_9MICO|nr:hypothetical protein [Agromyces ramosus]RZS64545.1 hypothetical protein EV187_2932 [Agromyces ramosus]
MELLNISPVPYLPSTMWLVFRALADTPDLNRAELIDAVCPSSMLGEKLKEPAHVSRAIDALVTFEMLVTDDGNAYRSIGNLDLGTFTRELRRRTLVSGNESNSPDDLVRALQWLVEQSPIKTLEFPTGNGVFVNDTRWNSFTYWATFLGFARDWPLDARERSVDPTAAVYDAIFYPFGGPLPGGVLELGSLLQHLRSELPILYSTEHDGVATVLPSTAFALRSLAARGHIRLERTADAQSVIRFPAGAGAKGEDYFSHVTVLGAAS